MSILLGETNWLWFLYSGLFPLLEVSKIWILLEQHLLRIYIRTIIHQTTRLHSCAIARTFCRRPVTTQSRNKQLAICVGFMVDVVALGSNVLRVLQSSFVSIMTQRIYTNLIICHRRYMILIINNVVK